MNTEEDRILKLCSAPSDFIDKLVVTFENVLEELSTEEPEKGQENTLGGEKNEYVTSPYRPYCPPVSTETPPRRSQHPSPAPLIGLVLGTPNFTSPLYGFLPNMEEMSGHCGQ